MYPSRSHRSLSQYLVVAATCLFGFAAHASGESLDADSLRLASDPGLRAAIAARNATVDRLADSELRGSTQFALNHLVALGIRELRASGDAASADRFHAEWNDEFSTYFTSSAVGWLDLGDHKPLSNWLAGFYAKLEGRLGVKIVRSGVLYDIWALNYAIPVVFAPKAKFWHVTSTSQSIEYRKHFIPLANVVTYWASLIGCRSAMAQVPQVPSQISSRLCKMAAKKLRWAMGRYVAPKLSDFVYQQANGRRASAPLFTNEELHYLTVADLAREIH